MYCFISEYLYKMSNQDHTPSVETQNKYSDLNFDSLSLSNNESKQQDTNEVVTTKTYTTTITDDPESRMCIGCRFNRPQQSEHMGQYGCLGMK